jgi:amino-acid N-acetyltransferase
MTSEGRSWPAAHFTEKAFYLAEFRGRTLALAYEASGLRDPRRLSPVLTELERNRTRVLVLTSRADSASRIGATPIEQVAGRLEGSIWRGFQASPRVAWLVSGGAGFARACREVAVRLGVAKLVFLDPAGALVRGDGARQSFVGLGELSAALQEGRGDADKRAGLLREIEAALGAGLPAVNVCTAEGLADELFTYAGSGTLFTRERYVDVRRLGIDDFAAADDLVARGVAEGYLAERSPDDLDRVFANGFGAFVEGRHLAGIGALLPHPESGTGEIASLYTLTRFLGEGIGSHLVSALCEHSRERGDVFVFACTTTERVARFFERHGFRRVSPDEIPAEKWRNYDARRRPRVRCLRRDPS